MVRIIIEDDSDGKKGKLVRCPRCGVNLMYNCPVCKGTGYIRV